MIISKYMVFQLFKKETLCPVTAINFHPHTTLHIQFKLIFPTDRISTIHLRPAVNTRLHLVAPGPVPAHSDPNILCMSRGSGPTKLISPFMMLINSGSSSRLVLQSHYPSRVKRSESGSRVSVESRKSAIAYRIYIP